MENTFNTGDKCYLIMSWQKCVIGEYTVKSFDGEYYFVVNKNDNRQRARPKRLYQTEEEARAAWQVRKSAENNTQK